MAGKSHDEALKIFKGAKKGFLTLIVRPYKDSQRPPSASMCLSPTETIDDGIGSIGSDAGDITLQQYSEMESHCVTLDFHSGMRLGLLLKPAVMPYTGFMEVRRTIKFKIQFYS